MRWRNIVTKGFVTSSLMTGRGSLMLSARSRQLSSGPTTVKNMSVEQFISILKNAEARASYQILDVREGGEVSVSSVPGSDLIYVPLSDAGIWGPKVKKGEFLDPSKKTICMCHHGARSFRVANFLVEEAQFDEVYNLVGGIHAISQVDTSIPTY